MNILSTKKTSVTSTASINCHIIKVRDCYILHTVLLVIILLLIIMIICYHFAKNRQNLKCTKINLKKFLLKNVRDIILII